MYIQAGLIGNSDSETMKIAEQSEQIMSKIILTIVQIAPSLRMSWIILTKYK